MFEPDNFGKFGRSCGGKKYLTLEGWDVLFFRHSVLLQVKICGRWEYKLMRVMRQQRFGVFRQLRALLKVCHGSLLFLCALKNYFKPVVNFNFLLIFFNNFFRQAFKLLFSVSATELHNLRAIKSVHHFSSFCIDTR